MNSYLLLSKHRDQRSTVSMAILKDKDTQYQLDEVFLPDLILTLGSF